MCVTYIVFVIGLTAIEVGDLPTRMSVIFPESPSITMTLSEPEFATYILFVALLMANPPRDAALSLPI